MGLSYRPYQNLQDLHMIEAAVAGTRAGRREKTEQHHPKISIAMILTTWMMTITSISQKKTCALHMV
jgi:hypothetical protein